MADTITLPILKLDLKNIQKLLTMKSALMVTKMKKDLDEMGLKYKTGGPADNYLYVFKDNKYWYEFIYGEESQDHLFNDSIAVVGLFDFHHLWNRIEQGVDMLDPLEHAKKDYRAFRDLASMGNIDMTIHFAMNFADWAWQVDAEMSRMFGKSRYLENPRELVTSNWANDFAKFFNYIRETIIKSNAETLKYAVGGWGNDFDKSKIHLPFANNSTAQLFLDLFQHGFPKKENDYANFKQNWPDILRAYELWEKY